MSGTVFDAGKAQWRLSRSFSEAQGSFPTESMLSMLPHTTRSKGSKLGYYLYNVVIAYQFSKK